MLDRRGIVPGIKVDKGTAPLANAPGDLITRGLDGLPERLKGTRPRERFLPNGARFTPSPTATDAAWR